MLRAGVRHAANQSHGLGYVKQKCWSRPKKNYFLIYFHFIIIFIEGAGIFPIFLFSFFPIFFNNLADRQAGKLGVERGQ